MSNVARILDELVSLEAWHKPHEIEVASPFHVALTFSEARMSGGSNEAISFRVRLKKATLVIVCDEDLVVPLSSKLREYPNREWTIKSSEAQSEEGAQSSKETNKSSGGISIKGPSLSVDDAVERTDAQKANLGSSREITETMQNRIMMIYRSVGSEHHWDCAPLLGESLNGVAHPGNSPIMATKPNRDARLDMLGIRVFLKCKAEDLDIPPDDIQASPTLKERFVGEDLDRRLRLAREVIKAKLAASELEVCELEPRYQDVIIADLIAQPET